MPQLYVLSGPDAGRSFVVSDGTTVGRSPECDVRLREGSISRKHAHFEQRDGSWWVVDDGSRNGVLVDSVKVPSAELPDHQEFRLGELLMRFRFDDSVAPAAPAPVPAAPPAEVEEDEEIVLEGSQEDVSFDPGIEPPSAPAAAAPRAPAAGAFPTARPLAETVITKGPPARPRERGGERGADDPVGLRGGVLQFHKQQERRGIAVTDLTQYPVWVRWFVYAVVLVLAAGLSFLAFRGTSSMREKLQEPETIETPGEQ